MGTDGTMGVSSAPISVKSARRRLAGSKRIELGDEVVFLILGARAARQHRPVHCQTEPLDRVVLGMALAGHLFAGFGGTRVFVFLPHARKNGERPVRFRTLRPLTI